MSTVEAIIAAEVAMPPAPDIARAAEDLQRRFGETTVAILFYGAGLRDPRTDGLWDFYVLIDDLTVAIPHPLSRLAARVLPPNVYFVDCGGRGAKVAVMTPRAFRRGMDAFAPQLWARFAQQVSVAYARDPQARAFLVETFAAAVRQLARAVRPLLPPNVDAQDFWTRAFAETYRAELRPESPDRATALIDAPRYVALMEALKAEVPLGNPAWALRRAWGKLLNALRLMKAAFTFDGGLDYAVAKIARHTGVEVRVRDSDRRVPLLGGIRIFVEAWRRGGVR